MDSDPTGFMLDYDSGTEYVGRWAHGHMMDVGDKYNTVDNSSPSNVVELVQCEDYLPNHTFLNPNTY